MVHDNGETVANHAESAKNPNRSFRTALPQIIAVAIKNVLLFGYGLTLGYPTIIIPNVQGGIPGEKIVLNSEEISWISSMNLIMVPMGCLISGFVTQPIGRKRSMQLVNIPFMAAWLFFYYSSNVSHLYIGLCLTGLGGGLLEAPVLTYVAEVTQPHLRGTLSATSSTTILFGIFIQFLSGTFLNWRTAALVNITFPILAILLLFIVPESPHWLILKKRYEEAQRSLAWLRGWTTVDAVTTEYNELCCHIRQNLTKGVDNPAFVPEGEVHHGLSKLDILKRFATRQFVVPYILVSFAFFLGSFCGVTTLQTYAVKVFQTLETPIDKYYATLLLGIAQIVGAVLCVILIHYAGKRILTFVSLTGCGICMIVVAIYAHTLNYTHLVNSFTNTTGTSADALTLDAPVQWIPMLLIILSIFLACCSIRLLPWILIAEVFPGEIRAISSSLSGAISYVFSFIANKTFLSMVQTFTLPGTFGFYGLVSILGTGVLFFILPETEGRTLPEIENHFKGAKRLSKMKFGEKRRRAQVGLDNPAFDGKSNGNAECCDSKL